MVINLVSAQGAEPHPLSGATKDAKRSISLPALSTLGYSRIPPPTADLPKRFGLCLFTTDINGALHWFNRDSTRLRQQFPQRVSLLLSLEMSFGVGQEVKDSRSYSLYHLHQTNPEPTN